MEELSPEAKSLYEMLMAETREEYESMFMAHKRKILDAVRVKASSTAPLPVPCDTAPNAGSSASTMTAPPSVSSSAASIGGIPELAAATATPERGLHPVSPSNCSTICSGSDTSAASTPSYEVLVLASPESVPASPITVSAMLPSPTEIEHDQDAVHLGVAGVAASAPTTCSTDRPTRAAISTVSAFMSSASPTSSTTTCGVVPEPAAPADSNKSLEVDVIGDTPPTAAICLHDVHDHKTGAEDPKDMSLTPKTNPLSAPMGIPGLVMLSPTTCSTVCHVSTVSQAPMVLDVAPVAVNRDTSHLAAPTLSSCSTICLAGDPSATMTPWYQTVVPASPKSTGSVSERCCFGPEPATAISTPTSALDLLEGGASISSLTPATYLLEDVDISMFSENMLPPWYPPWSTCIQNLHQLDGHDMPPLLPLLVESVECIRGRIAIRFCLFSSQVAEMFLFCCAACSIPNLHYMMDPKQISRDWLFSTTMELQWNANLAAINFTLGVQSVQLQPILSNWSVTLSDMMLAVASIVAGLLDTSLITQVTTQNGSGAYLTPVLCLIINLFSWSPHYKWPPLSLNGPFLISVDVQQEFMGMYIVTAVLSWLCIFVSARCSTVLLLPWDPGVLMDGMCAKFHVFVIERTQPRLCAMKSPWPPPSSSRSTFYRTLNLHRTLDNMQLWVGCQVLKTWELQWSSVLIVIASAPRVKAHLKPTVFKWSNPFCLDKQFLSECTLDFLLARRTASIVWNYCCLDNLQCYLGSTNWALQEEQQPVLLQMPWQSFSYHWKAAYPMKPCSAIEGMFVKISTDQPRQDLHGSDEKSILHFTSFYDNNQLHVLVALGTFRCEFFSLGNTWDCLHYEYLQQWRPPDQTTEFLSVQHQWRCHAETVCLRFTGRYLHGASEHLVSTLLLEFRCQSSQEYCDSARAVTRGQIVHSIAHNYSAEIAVVIYTTHNGMELIIGWASRSIGCSSWTEDFLPTRILELYNSLSRLKVSQYFCSQVCEWQIPWWDVTSTVESVTTIKHISDMFSHALQYVEDGKYFAVVNLLMSSRLSHAWVLYRPVACIIHLGSKMIQWEIASSDDGIFTYTKRVLISWDPGGLNNVLAPAWNITQLEFWHSPWDPGGYSLGMHLHFSPGRYFVICYLEIEITSMAVNSILLLQLPWDPGGLIDIGLRTSRILWGRDCQRPTSLHSLLGWLGGPLPWALACSGMVKEGNMKHIYPGELREEIGWTERKRRLRAEARLARVACPVPPSSS